MEEDMAARSQPVPAPKSANADVIASVDVAGLLEIARKATPGPWNSQEGSTRYPESDDADFWNVVLSPAGREIVTLHERYSMKTDDRRDYDFDAAHIAAFNPATVISILEALAESEERARILQAAVHERCGERKAERTARLAAEGDLNVIHRAAAHCQGKFGGRMSEVDHIFQEITRVSSMHKTRAALSPPSGPENEGIRSEIAVSEGDTQGASTPLEGALPADVVRLVIAAREVAFNEAAVMDDKDRERFAELDAASEAFADRVPWEDEPAQQATPLAGDEPKVCEDCDGTFEHLNDGLCGGCEATRLDGLLMDRDMGDS